MKTIGLLKEKTMKTSKNKYIPFLIALLLFSFFISSANEYNRDHVQHNNIASFIRVWGLVKYRSPHSISGKLDVDQVFLSQINKVKNLDKSGFNKVLIEMLISAGLDSLSYKNDQIAKEKDTENHLLKNIDYSWIGQGSYEKELKTKLYALSMMQNRTGKHYYMPSISHVGDLPNEKSYKDYTFNREEMNLLALAKAWNAIEYLFPYKYKIDKSWQQALLDLIPVFSAVNSRTGYERAVLQLETAIDDSHASGFLGQMKNKPEIFKLSYYPPFAYQVYQDKALVKAFLNDSLAGKSELKKGDLIVEINGIKMSNWIKQRSALLPASNQAIKHRLLSTNLDGTAYLFGDLERVFKVKVLRDKRYVNLTVEMLDRANSQHIDMINAYFQKQIMEEKKIQGYEDLENEVGLIRAGYFFEKSLPAEKDEAEFLKKLNNKKTLIFDMREYPQAPGLFYYYIPMAMGTPTFKFARYYGADIQNPGSFFLEKGVEIYLSKDIAPTLPLYKGKIVILTNEYTRSMGEWFTMMLRQLTPNTTVIGSQTSGADGDLKHLNLPGGYDFLFTGNGIFYPNGKETQRIGILPDVQYKPTIQDILSAQDTQLIQALKYIENKK